MKFLFYLGHPAHFHLFKIIIMQLRNHGHEVRILIKKKDVLEQLLLDSGWEYINILPEGRKDSRFSIALGMLKRDHALWRITRSWRPDLMAGTSSEVAHIGFMRSITSVVVNEDDWDAVPLFSWMVYPYCSRILAPDCCATGRWEEKTIHYAGYHELTYLHPDNFKPDPDRVAHLFCGRTRYFILRFASLNAHHDRGVAGLHTDLVEKIISRLEPYGTIHITSERPLESQFEPYQIRIAPLEMHHALAFADLYIGDSQTMTAEAAVLGTPALRYNDFVGRIGYLKDLESRYQLTFGYRTSQTAELLAKIDELLTLPECKVVFQERRAKMLSEKIEVSAFITNIFERMAIERKS